MIKPKFKKRLRYEYKHKAWRVFNEYHGFWSRAWICNCLLCGKETNSGHPWSAQCYECRIDRMAQFRAIAAQAHRAVMRAINQGDLASLYDGEVPCVDCGEQAEVYDHRDYSKPLKVDPVCQACNVKRGPATDVAHLYLRTELLAKSRA